MRFSDMSWDHKITDTAPYNVNLIHINPYELPIAFYKIGREVWDRRYNIAFWLWELERFPEHWVGAIKLVDEIWTPSDFAGEGIRKVTDKPVRTMPYALAEPETGAYGRVDFQLPDDKFLFLCMYDCNSFMERKNPMAAIHAFKRAFTAEENGVGLVLKLNNPQENDIHLLKNELSGYGNWYIIDRVLEKTQVNALIACADAYVSLHRSEGFGLVPAEAMLLGTPVIATGWSANTEFMAEGTACLVDFRFVTIEEDCGPYEAGNRWADPDVSQAAGYMRKLFEDEGFRRQIADSAKAHIKEKLSPERSAAMMRDRIEEIYQL
jgi:glycosyltransferase involved in cell wall biosynthesis